MLIELGSGCENETLVMLSASSMYGPFPALNLNILSEVRVNALLRVMRSREVASGIVPQTAPGIVSSWVAVLPDRVSVWPAPAPSIILMAYEVAPEGAKALAFQFFFVSFSVELRLPPEE